MPVILITVQGGAAYFFAIFSANLLSVIVYFVSKLEFTMKTHSRYLQSVSAGTLKPLLAPESQVITSVIASRYASDMVLDPEIRALKTHWQDCSEPTRA
jgi:hypothetical protein